MSHNHDYNSQKPNIKKTNWIFIGIFLFVVLIAGAFVMSSPTASNQQTGKASTSSKLAATETFFDFGTISMAKGKVTKAFTVKNTTSEPITVSKIYTSCMCTQASLVQGTNRRGPFGMPGHGSVPTISEAVAPGAEAVVEVVFDPAAHGPSGVGPIQRNIFVESTDSGKLTLEFKANVTP